MVKAKYAVSTDVGRRRSNNEDNYYAEGYFKQEPTKLRDHAEDSLMSDKMLFAVCDGMGGCQYGEIASLTAVSTLKEFGERDFSACLEEYIQTANNRICAFRRKNGSVSVGTTFVSLYIKDNIAHISNVGDSRAYLYRGSIKQYSYDDTEAQMMVDEGIISATQAKRSPAFHVLTQHVGLFPEVRPIVPHNTAIELRAGDVYLLCSDGLTDMLEDPEIEAVLGSGATAKEMTDELVKRALAAGGVDNVTVAVIKIEGISAAVRKQESAVYEESDNGNGDAVNESLPGRASAKKAKNKGNGRSAVIAVCVVLIAALAGISAYLFLEVNRLKGVVASYENNVPVVNIVEETEEPTKEPTQDRESTNEPTEKPRGSETGDEE